MTWGTHVGFTSFSQIIIFCTKLSPLCGVLGVLGVSK